MDSGGVIFFEPNYDFFLKPEPPILTILSSFHANQGVIHEPSNLSGHLHEGFLPVHRDLSAAPGGPEVPKVRNANDGQAHKMTLCLGFLNGCTTPPPFFF